LADLAPPDERRQGSDTYFVDDAGDVVTENAAPDYTPPPVRDQGTADLNGDARPMPCCSNADDRSLGDPADPETGRPDAGGGAELAGDLDAAGLADLNGDGKKDILYSMPGANTACS